MGVCGGKLCEHVHPALDYVRYCWILIFLIEKILYNLNCSIVKVLKSYGFDSVVDMPAFLKGVRHI